MIPLNLKSCKSIKLLYYTSSNSEILRKTKWVESLKYWRTSETSHCDGFYVTNVFSSMKNIR